jgi:nucleotide-binding universal stress UspA family protein
VAGETAIQRVRHFYADGVLARFTALDAALEALHRPAEVVFVMGSLPPDVASDEDRNARRALTEVLARAARADVDRGELTARILEGDTEPDRIAAFALGQSPPPRAPDPALEELSLADWRVELMSIVTVET